MMLWHRPGRRLTFVLTVLLLFHACIYPIKLNISSFYRNSTDEMFLSSDTLPSDEQMLSCRSNHSSFETAPSGRIRLLCKSAIRSFDFIGVCDIFLLPALCLLLVLRQYLFEMMMVTLCSLQLVKFLHKSDGKTSALYFSYKI